jgi:hypothetical protein
MRGQSGVLAVPAAREAAVGSRVGYTTARTPIGGHTAAGARANAWRFGAQRGSRCAIIVLLRLLKVRGQLVMPRGQPLQLPANARQGLDVRQGAKMRSQLAALLRLLAEVGGIRHPSMLLNGLTVLVHKKRANGKTRPSGAAITPI